MSTDLQGSSSPRMRGQVGGGRVSVTGFSSLHPIKRLTMWLDRRLGRRSRVDLPVKAFVRGVEMSVVLTDVSDRGFGLRGNFGSDDIDTVSVCMGRQQTIVGEVVWCDGERLGARLLKAS